MNIILFLLLMVICISLVYVVHKYFNKHEFYILTIIYTIISFILSFKMIDIFGININLGIVFSSGLLMILYYFVNKYDKKESNKFIFIIGSVLLLLEIFLLLNAFIIPSINDINSTMYYDLLLNNYPLFIFSFISLIGELVLGNYMFNILKSEEKNKILKTIIIVIGITFLSVYILMFINYLFIFDYKTSLLLALDNYLIKVVIVTLFIIIMNKVFKVKKVK